MRRLCQRVVRLRPQTPQAGIALVIPVHNDAEGLARLLARIGAMDLFAQIIVVDDGSDVPLPAIPGIILKRHCKARGGGVARNTGLAAVHQPYVMFLDADDLPTDELPLLITDLKQHKAPFDFCLFKHADSRVSAEGLWGQSDWDERFWTAAGLGIGTLNVAPRGVWPLLAQTANYPWNKLFRTQFLRNHRIACAPTLVHQDIPLHWLPFVHAARILVSDRICVWHHVTPAGDRLSNRSGVERLQVFEALAPVVKAMAQADPALRAGFVAFLPGLMDWITARIDPDLLDQLRSADADWRARNQALLGQTGTDLAARPMPPRQSLHPQQPPQPPQPVAFVYLARNAGLTFEALAEDIAALTRPGDRVVLVDDGSADDTAARIGRFCSQQGWGPGVQVEQIIAPPAGACDPPRGDHGAGINLALALLRQPALTPARLVCIAAGSRIDVTAFQAARAQAEAQEADLLVFPLRQWSLARDTVADPVDAADWPDRAGETPRAHALRLLPSVFRLVVGWPLLTRVLADRPSPPLHEGWDSHSDLALVWTLLQQAGQVSLWTGPPPTAAAPDTGPAVVHGPGPAVGHGPQPPAPGLAMLAAICDLIRADPVATDWACIQLPRLLDGLTPQGLAAVLSGGPAVLRGLAITDLPDGPGGRLLASLAGPTPAEAEQILTGWITHPAAV